MGVEFNFMVKHPRELHVNMQESGTKTARQVMHTASIQMEVSIEVTLLMEFLTDKDTSGGQREGQ